MIKRRNIPQTKKEEQKEKRKVEDEAKKKNTNIETLMKLDRYILSEGRRRLIIFKL